MNNGLFITVEGPDGSGKTTQLDFIRKYFEEKGEQAIFTREPGGTPISEKIRGIILDKRNEGMYPLTEALLYAASRAQHVAQVIKPALEHGKTVVCDRYVDSSIAYQGSGRGLGDSVTIINTFAIDGCIPDLTILLRIDPEIGRARITGARDRMESETEEFHRRVYEGYLELERSYPERIKGVDADRPVEEITAEIEKYLDAALESRHEF
ncbi:MAG: dTMP kinase [Eubacteriaceae bacterium]|jgi:dTMP kinase|nr:dTMP kinase [Eubacteriaceae bacterium]